MSILAIKTVNAAHLKLLLHRYCLRIGQPAESAASLTELQTAGHANPDIKICISSDKDPEDVLFLSKPGGVIVFNSTYSTWVGARVRLGVVHCEDGSRDLLVKLLQRVIQWSQDSGMQRVELIHPKFDADVGRVLSHLGFVDLTLSEAWHFARLDVAGLMKLSDRDTAGASVRVRPGTEADCGSVMSMIRELAEFEKLSDQVKITESQLTEDIFGPRKFASLLIAESAESGSICGDSTETPGTILGYALYFNEFWHMGRGVCLEDVFVKPEHRGRGVCSALFSAVAREALVNGCSFMSLCYLAWNSAAFEIYQRYGFVDITQEVGGSMHFWRLQRDGFPAALDKENSVH